MKYIEDGVYKKVIEDDAKENAQLTLDEVLRQRGKFKLSETQFKSLMEVAYIRGELAGIERVLRAIEIDDELSSKDLIVGEVQKFLLGVFSILKVRLNLKMNLGLEDLIWGEHATKKINNLSRPD